jgi:SAM-dependent methyltransferase
MPDGAPSVAKSETLYPYPDIPNPDLLDRIPLDARIVLDIGCGSGALGAAYRRFNPRARILGIEGNAGAAHIAATRLDQVAVGDVEANPRPFDLLGQIDCLIYGDVLEHMRDPWRLLREQAPLLSENGTALICVPNVEHWSLLARLLQGSFNYEDSGLLDRTHLRWFTRPMMERAIAEAGLVPIDVKPRIFDADKARAFIANLAPALAALGVDPANYESRALPLQYVWRARRQPVTHMTVISTMLQPVGGVSDVRVIEPMRSLVSDPSIRALLSNGREIPRLDADSPKIFILHRPALLGEQGLQMVRPLLANGYVVVTEFDDHPDYIPILQHPEMHNFRAVHAVQTTTAPLAEILRAQNPEVAIFPNGIRMLPDVRNHVDQGHMTLFFGGLNREGDWPPYMDALNEAATAAGDRLRFVVVHDQGFFDALQTPHKSFSPMLDYAAYTELLGRCEISFMPLVDNPFNRSKSDLKFIEAASCRLTALASPVVYASSIQDGRTGLLFHTPEELRQKLLALVANPAGARAIGDAARAYVMQDRMLAYQMADRTAWYRSLWARREELTAALLARVPELAS